MLIRTDEKITINADNITIITIEKNKKRQVGNQSI